MRVLAFLMPVAALLVVGVAAAVLLLADGESTPPAATVPADSTPTPTPTSAVPRLSPGQSVCQGVLHIPEPGSPRVVHAEYTQQREVLGFLIVGNADVPVEALDIAAETVSAMFSSATLRAPLVENGAYIVVAAKGQAVNDLPEFNCLVERYGEGFFTHVCGIADRADYPLVSVNAADLLGDPEGPCRGRNVLYHELGHLVQGWVLSSSDYVDIRVLYQEARTSGVYRESYAMRNANEYFAEATQAWFDSNDQRPTDREWLRRNDPQLYRLLSQIYGE